MSEPVGIDTNILVYAGDKLSEKYGVASRFVRKVFEGEVEGVVAMQNLVEYCAVVTDKRRSKRVLSAEEAEKDIHHLLAGKIKLIRPLANTLAVFGKYLVSGEKYPTQKVHDIFLAATLLSNGVKTLITENVKDFAGIAGLKAVGLEEWGKGG